MGDTATPELLRQISELNARIDARLAEDPPNLPAATEAQRELARLERQRNRLWLQRTAVAGQGPVRGLPLREQAANALSELQLPSSPSFISWYHESRFGERLPIRRLSSLKRDEMRSWKAAPRQRPFYIVSALEASRLQPVRGLLALSTFEPELRFIGPLSARVDYLRTVARICFQVEQADSDAGRQALEQLLWQFARNLSNASKAGGAAWVEELNATAQAELSRFEEEDRADRQRAAKRAEKLSEIQRLFGAPPLVAVDGGALHVR